MEYARIFFPEPKKVRFIAFDWKEVAFWYDGVALGPIIVQDSRTHKVYNIVDIYKEWEQKKYLPQYKNIIHPIKIIGKFTDKYLDKNDARF